MRNTSIRRLAVRLAVNISKQGKCYVAYAPALDISTTGKTEKDAQKKFEALVNVFFEELEEAGTLSNVLRDLGWRVNRKEWCPPSVVQREVDVRVPAVV